MARGKVSRIGDTRTSPNDYHYTRTAKGWQLTHKIIAEKELGRELKPEERIRFIDGDRHNLSPDNIRVYTMAPKSDKSKLAQLKAKRDDLDAKIAELEAQ